MATPIGNLNIPTLQKGQRIADWQRLFLAAVAPLLNREGGERLAISMLPAYICRRIAEREVVREVVTEAENLDAAFKTLSENLDPPVDCTKVVQAIRSKDWEPGTYIDDYFYEVKAATDGAQAPLRMTCIVVLTQLPAAVQGVMNDWLKTKDEVTKVVAREFINQVRKVLVEKGIRLPRFWTCAVFSRRWNPRVMKKM